MVERVRDNKKRKKRDKREPEIERKDHTNAGPGPSS